MRKLYTIFILLGVSAFAAQAQQAGDPPATHAEQPYGKIDMSDLEMKDCEFEKGAGAEVLSDIAGVYYDMSFNLYLERHTRIKIFKDNAKDYANVKIDFYGGNRAESVYDVQAQTINLVNGKQEITKIDKKQIFTQNLDKWRTEITFSLPNVQAGSVIEYKYKEMLQDIPDWNFQHDIPTRYSELTTSIPDFLYYRVKSNNFFLPIQTSTKSEGRSAGSGADAMTFSDEITKRSMSNIVGLHEEPFMSSVNDNLSGISFQLISVHSMYYHKTFIDSWAKVGGALADDEDFGGQMRRKVTGEEAIIAKAKAIQKMDDRIAFVFNEVRNDMKWNEIDNWYTNDGTYRAWEKKTGNATEINLILYHLLKQSGVNVYPMIVSTRKHGKVNPAYPFLYQFNRAVAYIPVDSTKHYILDASDKYNVYNETPYNLLNSYGLYINKEKDSYDMLFLTHDEPVHQTYFISAEIKPEGKVNGTVQIQSYAYNKMNIARQYKTDGEKKYIDYLRDGDNGLKISSLKLENMDVDTLPLTQHINFDMELSGSDGGFIYLNPSFLTSMKSNPFVAEDRQTNIDFGYNKTYTINEIFKVPTGFKSDGLPKNVSMTMPDKSITFKRFVVEQDGQIVARYQISYGKSVFFRENYGEFHEFYKKMNEFMNEQIVLKKS